MSRCAECGHSYFSASSRGHRSGLCVACRLRKNGGVGRGRLNLPEPQPSPPSDDWINLREAAPLLGIKITTLQTLPWLVRLGAMKVGQRWWVARTVLDGLKDQRD